ncbi:MAG: radical SAM protein [Bacteroidota bacterium]|nr:radical SAM protein [Bacteroidota bacterium]MDP4197143.1 radical SAM protein [Bacteroidota bacterium]
MHITLHLTNGCNMKCDYCYAPPADKRSDMTEDIAFHAVEYGSNISPENCGIIFFGGEPLLKKELITSTIEFSKELKKKRGFRNHFKVTTNGLLLDEDFLEYCKSVNLMVALSIDGNKEAHNMHRKTRSGEFTFNVIEPKINLLLKYQPYASFYMTVTPENVKYYSESFTYLIGKGAKYIIASLNYAGNWNEESLAELKKQYKQLAHTYEKLTIEQRKFYFSPFEVKFSSHIKNDELLCEKCHLGMRQVSVAFDGKIYPCVQFVSRPGFEIGDVWNGIDENRRASLYKLSQSKTSECERCAVSSRCNNNCSCLNIQTTGNIEEVSPILCETERMLIPIVDRLGGRLYKKRAPMFIQKHFNSAYPLLSLLEDMNN